MITSPPRTRRISGRAGSRGRSNPNNLNPAAPRPGAAGCSAAARSEGCGGDRTGCAEPGGERGFSPGAGGRRGGTHGSGVAAGDAAPSLLTPQPPRRLSAFSLPRSTTSCPTTAAWRGWASPPPCTGTPTAPAPCSPSTTSTTGRRSTRTSTPTPPTPTPWPPPWAPPSTTPSREIKMPSTGRLPRKRLRAHSTFAGWSAEGDVGVRVLRAGLSLVRDGEEGLGSAARKRVVFLIFYCRYFLKGGERGLGSTWRGGGSGKWEPELAGGAAGITVGRRRRKRRKNKYSQGATCAGW